ncbi:MAG TPA: hypothetical protein VN748_11615 [Pseudonocardiaceae bacterium]|jgi:hypothetical protein|nr:hypothetical protein [Pseudonocardiaceae bacterium]
MHDRDDEPLPPPAGALPVADLVPGQALADVATIGTLPKPALRRSEVLTE